MDSENSIPGFFRSKTSSFDREINVKRRKNQANSIRQNSKRSSLMKNQHHNSQDYENCPSNSKLLTDSDNLSLRNIKDDNPYIHHRKVSLTSPPKMNIKRKLEPKLKKENNNKNKNPENISANNSKNSKTDSKNSSLRRKHSSSGVSYEYNLNYENSVIDPPSDSSTNHSNPSLNLPNFTSSTLSHPTVIEIKNGNKSKSLNHHVKNNNQKNDSNPQYQDPLETKIKSPEVPKISPKMIKRSLPDRRSNYEYVQPTNPIHDDYIKMEKTKSYSHKYILEKDVNRNFFDMSKPNSPINMRNRSLLPDYDTVDLRAFVRL